MGRGWSSRVFLVLGGFMSYFQAFGQLDCAPDEPNWMAHHTFRPNGVWTGHVFQLSPNYRPAGDNERPIFTDASDADRVWKGFLLRDGNDFLPASGLNFDTQFSDYTAEGLDAGHFFPTASRNSHQHVPDGCATELQHFGVYMKTRYTIPEPGIYRVRVGSDDGSFLRIFDPPTNNTLLEVNGNPAIHHNWFKTDPPFTFIYADNMRNFYIPFEGGEEIWIDLRYYEKRGRSRLSFNFELYFGPGEIAVEKTGNSEGDYCGINPNPPEFLSLGPAVFAEGTEPNYQWQYSLTDGPEATWIDIEGANGLTYKIPESDEGGPESFSGTRYFRRVATNQVVAEDEEGNEETLTNFFASNVLTVTVNPIEELDRFEYGDNQWIGHIYRGASNNSRRATDYLGRHYEDMEFSQTFMDVPYTGPSSQSDFHPDHGCPFFIDNFTVQYRMRFEAKAGTYDVKVSGDDGFTLSIDGGNSILPGISSWLHGHYKERSARFSVEKDTVLYMILNYWEGTRDQLIQFEFINYTPVEWGQVSGDPCGPANCIKWETIQEKNTSHFIVEKSNDAKEWVSIGDTIDAQGNSTEPTLYDFRDEDVERERTYYRIKQFDLDGSLDYSEVIRVDNPNIRRSMLPFPNPTLEKVRFKTQHRVIQVKVISMDHRINGILDAIPIGGEQFYEVDFAQLPSGQYIMTIVTEEDRKSHKIIKR
jgi:hypothetical protein